MQPHLQIHRIASILFLAMLTGSVRAEMLLYVGAANGNSVQRFNATTGAFIDNFAVGGYGQSSLAFGPDGRFFVGEWNGMQPVGQYDGTTGAFLGTFVSSTHPGSTIVFGPDNNLYAAYTGYFPGVEPPSIRRYNGLTGQLLDTFIPSGSGGLLAPSGMRFGPDGNLYVRNITGIDGTSVILRFDGQDGSFLGNFVSSVSPAAGGIGDLIFGPDGNLYVAVLSENVVRRYDGLTGAFIDDFASGSGLNMPFGLSFGPDGNLYVVSSSLGTVLRYDGSTGEFMDTFATGSNIGPTYLLFADVATVPEPSIFALGAVAMLFCGYSGRHRVS